MGFKLIILAALTILLALVTSKTSIAAVISPSSLDIPVLAPNMTYIVDFASDVQLELLETNCTVAQIQLVDDTLSVTVPAYVVSTREQCHVLVNELHKKSVSFSFPIVLQIDSPLFSNVTISYNETTLVISNAGTGQGVIWMCEEALCSRELILPKHTEKVMPHGLVRVCSDETCETVLFTYVFEALVQQNVSAYVTNQNNHAQEKKGESTIVVTIKIVVVLVLILITICMVLSCWRYFARRNRTLLKDTR